MSDQPTNKELFNSKKQFNKFLDELTELESKLIIEMMDEARELGYDKGCRDAEPILWQGWVSTEKELPPNYMDGEQLIICLSFEKTENIVLCVLWKGNKFHSLENDDVYENVTFWSYLPSCV